jgi:hypothetical protein
MSGPQKGIFDDARKFIDSQETNFSYVQTQVPALIQSVLKDPTCFKGNRIQQIKSDLDALMLEVDQKVNDVRAQAIEKLNTLQQRMHGLDEFQKLPEVRMTELDAPYQELIEHIKQQGLIAVINDRLRYFEEQGYQKLLTKLNDLTTVGKESKPEYIASRHIDIAFDKAWLADEIDVDRYLESMRKALLLEIRNGKIIQI